MDIAFHGSALIEISQYFITVNVNVYYPSCVYRHCLTTAFGLSKPQQIKV